MKRGQVTIFVIIAIIIVVGLLGVIYLMAGERVENVAVENPRQFIRKCVADAVEDSIPIILKNGGEINPSHTIMYRGEEYNYLCYQAEYYKNCINTHPMLKKIIEEEIRNYTIITVQSCFNNMREELENKGFDVSGEGASYSIDLVPGSVKVELRKNITISKGESSQSIKIFDTYVNSPLYWLVDFARGIINDEATTCNKNYDEFILMYPDYNIGRVSYDFSKTYTIGDRNTGDEFKFAVRSCVLPPGL